MPIFSFTLTMRASPGASGNDVLADACRRLAAANTSLLPTGIPGISIARCESVADAPGSWPAPADDDDEKELRRLEAELGVEADDFATDGATL